MKRNLLVAVAANALLSSATVGAQTDADNFYKSDRVNTEKVSFLNQYKMKVAGNLFLPKEMKEGESRPAIIVGHPMGAVKEQSANLYATKMAEQGFDALSIDLPFWGESEGMPRNAVSVEVYAEPKELLIVPGAGHVDLYDRTSLIPFDRLKSFFKAYLNK